MNEQICEPLRQADRCGQSRGRCLWPVGGAFDCRGDSHAGHGTAAIILLEFFTGLDFSKPADSLDQWQVNNFEK